MHKIFLCAALCLSCINRCSCESTKQDGVTCPYPILRQNGSDMTIDVVGFLRGIAEIKFNGAFGKSEAKRFCKIKCVNGEWIGPSCLPEGGSEGSAEQQFHPIFRSCSSKIFHSKFVLSFRNKTILNVRDFPHESVVQVRCKRFGVFKLIGDAHLSCHNGAWKHRVPTCIPTSLLTNFTDDSAPPSIAAKITSGSASIEPTGELAVYPGSTVHLECFYLRSYGEPEWSWTSTYRSYTTGWSIDSEERDWKYRLSIYYVKPQDTGIYTCSTPKGLTHSIVLNVIEVHCDLAKILTNDPNLLTQIQGSRLGQSAAYQCREGFKLNGTSTVTCQASGVWSGYPPLCVPVVCPDLRAENRTVHLVKQDFGYGGEATFNCPFGHKLIGVASLVCLASGKWSGRIPTCKEIFCASPPIPENLMIDNLNNSENFPFRLGSKLVFSCKKHQKIIGAKTIYCRDSGVWSNPPPICKASCSHPGDPSRGRFVPRKLEYDVGERISLSCAQGFESTSKTRPKCQKNGSWTELGMKCTSKITFKLVEVKSKHDANETRSSSTTTESLESVSAIVSTEDSKAGHNDSQTYKNINDTDIFYIVEEQPL